MNSPLARCLDVFHRFGVTRRINRRVTHICYHNLLDHVSPLEVSIYTNTAGGINTDAEEVNHHQGSQVRNEGDEHDVKVFLHVM